MILEGITLADRRKATIQFPVLLAGANNAGKTYAVENLPQAEKKRTVIFNMDIKPVGEGDSEEFYKIYGLAATSGPIDNQIALITQTGLEIKSKNDKDPMLEVLREQLGYLTNIKNNTFFIDDTEAIDKLVARILIDGFDPNVDRLILDTLTAMTDFCEAWANENFKGREIWATYGKAHQKVLQAFKEVSMFYYKYVYVMAHHDYIPPAQYDHTPKQVVKVKGGIMSGNVEAHFNSVIFAYMDTEGKRIFHADYENPLDTSRTKIMGGKFKFERTSLDDLEQLIAGTKIVVNNKLTEV